jgi:hypothetical protein
MEEFSIYGMALVPVILAMVELLKRVGIPKKFSPITALILGILSGFYYLAPGEPQKAIFLGLISGLSAIGLWSGTKNTLEELSNNSNNKLLRINAVKNSARSARKLKWKKTIPGIKESKRTVKK